MKEWIRGLWGAETKPPQTTHLEAPTEPLTTKPRLPLTSEHDQFHAEPPPQLPVPKEHDRLAGDRKIIAGERKQEPMLPTDAHMVRRDENEVIMNTLAGQSPRKQEPHRFTDFHERQPTYDFDLEGAAEPVVKRRSSDPSGQQSQRSSPMASPRSTSSRSRTPTTEIKPMEQEGLEFLYDQIANESPISRILGGADTATEARRTQVAEVPFKNELNKLEGKLKTSQSPLADVADMAQSLNRSLQSTNGYVGTNSEMAFGLFRLAAHGKGQPLSEETRGHGRIMARDLNELAQNDAIFASIAKDIGHALSDIELYVAVSNGIARLRARYAALREAEDPHAKDIATGIDGLNEFSQVAFAGTKVPLPGTTSAGAITTEQEARARVFDTMIEDYIPKAR